MSFWNPRKTDESQSATVPTESHGLNPSRELPNVVAMHARHFVLSERGDANRETVADEDSVTATCNYGDGNGYDLITTPHGTILIILDHESEWSTNDQGKLFKGVPQDIVDQVKYSQFALLSDGELFASNVWWKTADIDWRQCYGPALGQYDTDDGGMGLLGEVLGPVL